MIIKISASNFILLSLVFITPLMAQESSPVVEWTAAQKKYQNDNDLLKYSDAAAKWHKDIVALRSRNTEESDSEAILLLGSSSIRLWTSANDDLAPTKIIRRGYGGAKYCDLAIHAKSLIEGLTFKGVVIFIANDIAGDELDKEPEEIVRLAGLVVETLRKQQPNLAIFLVEITPTPQRFDHWPKIAAANKALVEFCRTSEMTFFVKTADRYLNEEGKPRSELFTIDALHQNADGYRLWASIIKESLEENLK